MASDQSEAWAERAAVFGSGRSGVLFVGLPDRVNALIHGWHERVLRDIFLPEVPEGATILDLGCGYGRLSESVARHRPDVHLVGLDFVHLYCTLFDEAGNGAAVCADARALPFPECTFDAVLSVTALMYVKNSVSAVLGEIHRTLKPGGLALLLEPGYEFQRAAGWFSRFRRRVVSTASTGFTRSEFSGLALAANGLAPGLSGDNMRFTTLLPLLLLIRGTPLFDWFGGLATERDARPQRQRRLALHRWMTIRRDASGAV